MAAASGYCKSCFRQLPDGVDVCASCAAQSSISPAQKVVAILGTTAIPFLLKGMVGLNPKPCLIGVAIAATAAALYVVLGLRS